MTKPVEAIVKAVLAKNGRSANLLAAVEFGWAKATKHPDHKSFRRKTTLAHLMWEASVDKAIELLSGDDGVHVAEHHDTVSFVFDDLVLVRLKKADVKLHSSNYPTLLAEAFHEPMTDLFGFDGLQRVEIVHVLNQYETEIAWVGVVARDKAKVVWNHELVEEAKAMSLRPAKEKESTASLAKMKGDNAAKKGTGTGGGA